ncbi:MAG: polysaccharide biosynthesis protein, partial [Eubacterium sp.]|nr:polysaccharide biosynthesis protein [Eubacterium sp.]
MSDRFIHETEDNTNKTGGIFHFHHWHIITLYLVIYDVVTIGGSYFFALWLRFDCSYSLIAPEYIQSYYRFIPIYLVLCVLVYYILHMYHSLWRYAGYNEMYRALLACIICLFIQIIGMRVFCSQYLYSGRMPISYYLFGIILQLFFTVAIRFGYRFINLMRNGMTPRGSDKRPVMIFGAGNAARMLMKDLNSSRDMEERICCILDDNPNKWGRFIDGIPIVGGRESILSSVAKYNIEKIYVAIPSASPKQIRDILTICKETGCELFRMPDMNQLYTGELTVSSMREVSVEDLLGRDAIHVDMEEIYRIIQGKVILITGGGGSIGSELCRQIAEHNPRQLIIFDIYENNAYDIQLEIRKNFPYLKLETIIGSVRDSRKIFDVMETYHPQIVFHAAAHKHVPLMEDSPCEAIKNNAIGTYKTAFAAMVNGCEHFVLISTDKAVYPTNIMGASKRLCEMIIQAFGNKIKAGEAETIPQMFSHRVKDQFPSEEVTEKLRDTRTEFVAVRFGNVLGSNGSVIPLFKKQIAEGGPVTVTHPDIIRYFMTIPEAVSLVLQAAVYAKGGEIFVLDMGEAVKIDTLARNLIKLSGHKPDVDIMIEYTGLRPGEKLYEEKLMSE